MGRVINTTTGQAVYNISGYWSDKIFVIKDDVKSLLFDANTAIAHPKIVKDIEEQDPLESRRYNTYIYFITSYSIVA